MQSSNSAIYPSELELKDTSTSSTEVCYLDTNIKTGDVTTPFRISIYDKSGSPIGFFNPVIPRAIFGIPPPAHTFNPESLPDFAVKSRIPSFKLGKSRIPKNLLGTLRIEMTLYSELSTFLVWTATFPPIQLTVFTYLNW